MADEQIVTSIVATSDFSNLIADVQRVTASLAKMQQGLSLTNRTLAAQAGQIQKSFGETLRGTGQFTSHFVQIGSDVEKFGKSLDSGKLKLKDYYQTWQNHAKTSGGLIRDLAKQQVAMQQAIIQPLGKGADGLQKFNVHVANGINEIANKTAIAKKEMQIYNKVIQDGGVQLINWGKNTQWAGRQLTVGLTVPMAAFGAAAAKAFREADQELVRLTKVYGGLTATSAADLAKIRKDVSATAKELASAYGSSYKETIALAADIAATGKQGNELIKTTQETTRLSVLGEVDRQEAMKATLALQNAFKMNTQELSDSINFLNSVENQTSTSLQDLVEAIPKAGTVIQGMGGSVKDLALYLTAMKEGGVNASEGANAIKSSLASLINPTKVASDMFKGFGIDLGGIVTKNAGDLTGTILALQSALDTLDPLQKQKAIEQLFGKFQFARMNALFANLGKQGSQTLQVLDLMKASSQDLANVAGRELSQVTESASGKYRRALESLKADLATVGDQFLKFGTMFLNVASKIVEFFNKLPGPVKTFVAALGGITALAGPMIMLTGVMANFFGYIIKAIGGLKSLAHGGGGFKLLTPEIIAAEKAGSLIEKTFYSDAAAAEVLRTALKNLADEFTILQQKAAGGSISVAPTLSTIQGNIIAAGGQRVVNPASPYLDPEGKRSSAHMNPVSKMSEQERAAQTIFGMVPGPGPVNRRIGANPQIYAEGDLPKIPGVTSINKVSTGVVAGEAAKWHAMTAALSMQSESELKELKREVIATGTITTSLSESYSQLLPAMNTLISNAARESAEIVAELQASKINADQARAKIIALNARVEADMVSTATAVAASQGRTANLTTVPLLNQPVVNPATGKSNMKELFHKGSTANLLNKIAASLGVKTWGGRYSTETTMPKRLNTGGRVYTANDGSIVPGPDVNADVVPAMLTPGEFVVNRKATAQNLPLLKAINGGMGSTGLNKNIGGMAKPVSLQRTHITDDLSGMSLLLPRWVNMGVNAHGTGLTGSQIASGIRETLAAGYNPNDLMNEATVTLGGDRLQSERRNGAALSKLMNSLESSGNANRMFGGKDDPLGFERFAKEIYRPALRGIRVDSAKAGGTSNLYSAISQIFTKRAARKLTKDEAIARGIISGSTTGSNEMGQIVTRRSGRLSWVGQNKTIGSSMPSWARGTNLATLLTTASGVSHALKIVKRNSGGIIPGYIAGGRIPKLPESVIARLTANWPANRQFYKPGFQYKLGNQDPLHGPLQIGMSSAMRRYAGYDPNNYGLSRRVNYTDPQFSRITSAEQFLTGNMEERGKYATAQYMEGNLDIMSQMERLGNHPLGPIAAMKSLQKKFSGKLFRGIKLDKTFKGLPPELIDAIRIARSTGDASSLIGKEFIMRRSSWSKSPSIASYFAPGNKVDPNSLVIEAAVKNRNILPAGDLFPDNKFMAPYGQDWSGGKMGKQYRSEQEAIFGGKFRVVGFDKGRLKVETVVDGARANGGPVNAGRPYLVGENGPEVFVPRNNGGIIPSRKYAKGGFVAQNLGSIAGSVGGGMLGNMVGGSAGSLVGSMLGGMLPMGMGMRKSSDYNIPDKSILATTKYGHALSYAATGGSKLQSILPRLALGLTKLNVGIALGTTAAVLLYKAYQKNQESLRLTATSYGLTADAAQRAGLKHTDYNNKIKDSIENTKLLIDKNRIIAQSMTSAKTPFSLTITEYKKLQKEIKATMADQVKLFDKTSMSNVSEIAIRLKEQFMAAGMSAEDAAKKIYTMISLSNKSGMAASTIGSKGFSSINTPEQASVGAFKQFNVASQFGDAKAQAAALNTALMSVDTGIASIIKTAEDKAKKDKVSFDASKAQYTAQTQMLEMINTKVKSQKRLSADLLDELKKQNPQIRSFANESDTALSIWQKLQIAAAGFTGDLSRVGSAGAGALYRMTQNIKSTVEATNKGGILKSQYKELQMLQDKATKATKAMAGQSVKQQISDQEAIKLIDKKIAAINKEADARIKAIRHIQEAENFTTSLKKKQLEYQDALASGDMSRAAQAQLDITQMSSARQSTLAEEAITNARDKKIAPLEKQKTAINDKQQALANSAALASESVDALNKKISDQKDKIDAVNTAMANLIIAQQTHTGNIYNLSKALQKAIKESGVTGTTGKTTVDNVTSDLSTDPKYITNKTKYTTLPGAISSDITGRAPYSVGAGGEFTVNTTATTPIGNIKLKAPTVKKPVAKVVNPKGSTLSPSFNIPSNKLFFPNSVSKTTTSADSSYTLNFTVNGSNMKPDDLWAFMQNKINMLESKSGRNRSR